METKGERMIVKFNIPSRNYWFKKSITAGEAIMAHRFIGYEPYKGISGRNKGSLISMEKRSIPYSIDKLQDRGKFSLNQMLKFTKVK
jgi:GTP-binding protein